MYSQADCWNGVKELIVSVYGDNAAHIIDIGGERIPVRRFQVVNSVHNTPVIYHASFSKRGADIA